MSESYAREILRRNVAQICQTIGWNGISSTPLDILAHVLEKYIRTLGTQANRYAEQFNRTDPNLHDLGLVFQDLHVQLPELEEYTRCVPSVSLSVHVDKFRKPKEPNLNFLKPGSHEVVTRPMHVHEHLPPMYPEKEQDTPAVAGTVEIRQNGMDNMNIDRATCTSPEISVTDSPEKSKDIFKRPTDPVPLPSSKRPRLKLDEEERTREISSVMMTMSGFLSPAREGKLPEARPPTIISEKHYDKHKTNLHHANPAKVPSLEKCDKKSKKNKLLNGKIIKSKRKDKSYKGESSKSKDISKYKLPPGYVMKPKEGQHPQNHLPLPKVVPPIMKPTMPPSPAAVSVSELIRSVIKQEPIDQPAPKSLIPGEEAIPVPRKIPISKSPLVSNSVPVHKHQSSANSLAPDIEIKKEVIDEEEKLASQPDRSKINIFKRISNKSKEDKSAPEVVPQKLQSDSMISNVQASAQDNSNESKRNESVKVKTEEALLNNHDSSTVNLLKEVDLRAHEVINIDEDSIDKVSSSQAKPCMEIHPNISLDKTLQVPYPKDIASVFPKIKKEKRHKDKRDKAAKLEAKLLRKQQQQLAYEMAQCMVEKQNMKMINAKATKSGKPKNESKLPHMPPGFPFFPAMPPGRNLLPGPGLIPNPSLIPGTDFFTDFTNNPALRGLPSSNLLSNPFALGPGGPGMIPGPGYLQPGIPNPLMQMGGNYPHSSRSPSVKIPPMLRRPSLEVIPVDNDDERGTHKSHMMAPDKDRHDQHKSPTIPNILQKHKYKSHKEPKSSLYKMPPVQPDITIELNPPKLEKIDPVLRESPKEPLARAQSKSPDTIASPKVELPPHIPTPEPTKVPIAETPQDIDVDHAEKKKDKSHKKEKRDKDGIKIKKKKDKKDKGKKGIDKLERKNKAEMKEKVKKEKKEKKKEKEKDKSSDGLVPKLTLKLSSSNSNSPMPSSPDLFKLNIKPVVKKEEENSPSKEELVSREHSRSPELAQISALVTRPPKQKHSKLNHITETEPQSSSPPSGSSPPTKHRPPSSHSKYKRILFKPLSKKGHFEDDIASMSEDPSSTVAPPAAVPSAPLPTPYYIDEHGNKIWVCPACGQPDNGSPMIGCDGCDGWYHWVCVGITEEPGALVDWFCKSCLAKRQAMALAGVPAGKKRGRKPKGEKIRDCH